MTPADIATYYAVFYLITRSYLVMVYCLALAACAVGFVLVCLGDPTEEQLDKTLAAVLQVFVGIALNTPVFLPVFGDIYWLAGRLSRRSK